MASQLRKLRAGQYVFRFRKNRYTTVIIHMYAAFPIGLSEGPTKRRLRLFARGLHLGEL